MLCCFCCGLTTKGNKKRGVVCVRVEFSRFCEHLRSLACTNTCFSFAFPAAPSHWTTFYGELWEGAILCEMRHALCPCNKALGVAHTHTHTHTHTSPPPLPPLPQSGLDLKCFAKSVTSYLLNLVENAFASLFSATHRIHPCVRRTQVTRNWASKIRGASFTGLEFNHYSKRTFTPES